MCWPAAAAVGHWGCVAAADCWNRAAKECPVLSVNGPGAVLGKAVCFWLACGAKVRSRFLLIGAGWDPVEALNRRHAALLRVVLLHVSRLAKSGVVCRSCLPCAAAQLQHQQHHLEPAGTLGTLAATAAAPAAQLHTQRTAQQQQTRINAYRRKEKKVIAACFGTVHPATRAWMKQVMPHLSHLQL